MAVLPTGQERYVLHLDREYQFARPTHAVWSLLSDVEQYPVWWRWLRQYRVRGCPGLVSGTALEGTVRPPIPYSFRVGISLDHVVEHERIVASLYGDLHGPASIVFRDGADGLCRMRIVWDVEMLKPTMRAAAHVSKDLMVWGHDEVVRVTSTTFARRVERLVPVG